MLDNTEKVKKQKKVETKGEAYTEISIDNNSLKYPVLISRNFRVQKLIVDISPNL